MPSKWDPPTPTDSHDTGNSCCSESLSLLQVLGSRPATLPPLPRRPASLPSCEGRNTSPISQMRQVRPAEADKQAPVLTAKDRV